MGIRISKALKQFNIGFKRLTDYLISNHLYDSEKELAFTTILSDEAYDSLKKEFAKDESLKQSAGMISTRKTKKSTLVIANQENANSKKRGLILVAPKAPSIEDVHIAKAVISPKKKIEKKEVTSGRHNILFSQLIIKGHHVRLRYKRKFYLYAGKSAKGLSEILNRFYNSISPKKKNKFIHKQIPVFLDEEKRTFEFIDFDLYSYVMTVIQENYTKGAYKPIKNSAYLHKKSEEDAPIATEKLTADNIEFSNRYYTVSLHKVGDKDISIRPLVVRDDYSSARLKYVHRYFADRLPRNILIEYNNVRITGINPPLELYKYIKILHENLNVQGEWWADEQNEMKPTLARCVSTSAKEVRERLILKSKYLDNLACLQNDERLILIYEINHGIKEDAFIFTATMPNNRYAIIFENAQDNKFTATEIFIAEKEDYNACVNLVFDYFTNYSIPNKRDSLRTGKYPPEKFKAQVFYSVAHDELQSWLVKIKQILQQSVHPTNIDFVSGLHVPQDISSRAAVEKMSPKNIHNQLMRKLFDILSRKYGEDNVGTEIRVDTKRIDTVVRKPNGFDIYEVKSYLNPEDCFSEAFGQIYQYACIYCKDRIEKMVIVGPSPATPRLEQYLSDLREQHSLNIYYMHVSIST